MRPLSLSAALVTALAFTVQANDYEDLKSIAVCTDDGANGARRRWQLTTCRSSGRIACTRSVPCEAKAWHAHESLCAD